MGKGDGFMTAMEVENSLNKYIYDHPELKTKDAITIYSLWRNETKISVHSPDVASLMIETIDEIKKMDKEILRLCIEFDAGKEF